MNSSAKLYSLQAADYIEENRTISEQAPIRQIAEMAGLGPVILTDKNGKPAGTVTAADILVLLQAGIDMESPFPAEKRRPSIMMKQEDSLFSYPHLAPAAAVCDADDEVIGVLTREAVMRAFQQEQVHVSRNEDILNIVFEIAYEGIAVVDKDAMIISMNNAYRSFLGIAPDADVIGRPVTEVIENTQLHRVVETGIPERGQTQMIQGQKMIVHRLPIWRGDELTGAIGMLIFEGVSELYSILEDSYERKIEAAPRLGEEEQDEVTFENMVGESRAIQMMKSKARKASRTKATILITGESGTGKEVFAKAIRNMSRRAKEPYVSINCAAIPDQLLEAELFGYEEGAFTGAKKGGQAGKFEVANKGTIFLDEIGDMPMHMQSKILRVLEEEAVVRVGGTSLIPLDVRIITATNQNLLKKVEDGTFRKDLYYRLNVIQLELPTLRERKEDIPVLVQYYVPKLSRKHQLEEKTFSKEAMQQMLSYEWPGNIRELVNVLEEVLTLTDGTRISAGDLPASVKTGAGTSSGGLKAPMQEERAAGERSLITSALEETGGNITKASKKLGIHRTTLHKKIRKYGIEV